MIFYFKVMHNKNEISWIRHRLWNAFKFFTISVICFFSTPQKINLLSILKISLQYHYNEIYNIPKWNRKMQEKGTKNLILYTKWVLCNTLFSLKFRLHFQLTLPLIPRKKNSCSSKKIKKKISLCTSNTMRQRYNIMNLDFK